MRLTLLSDGSTDQALLPLLRWLLQERSTTRFEQNWADLRNLPRPPSKLRERVRSAIDLQRSVPSFRALEKSLCSALLELGMLRQEGDPPASSR
jgi:hypothetical protein